MLYPSSFGDELQDTYPHMDNTAIRNTLAAFLFTGDDVFKLIRDLSGRSTFSNIFSRLSARLIDFSRLKERSFVMISSCL